MTEAEFWDRRRITTGGCWEYVGYYMPYGSLAFRGQQWLAHRLAWTLTYGPIEPGLQVCHQCDNPPCFNPTHLFKGTQLVNIADMKQKGRRRGRGQGEQNGRARLTARDVRQIRRRYQTNRQRWTQQALADAYDVSQSLIFYILQRVVWTHV